MNKVFSLNPKSSKATAVTLGVVLSLIVAAIMLMVSALILTLGSLSESIAFPLSSLSLGVGCFFGSRYTAKKLQEKGYLCGIINGGILFLLNTIVSIIINGFSFTIISLIRFTIVMLAGIIGGITGINSGTTGRLVK